MNDDELDTLGRRAATRVRADAAAVARSRAALDELLASTAGPALGAPPSKAPEVVDATAGGRWPAGDSRRRLLAAGAVLAVVVLGIVWLVRSGPETITLVGPGPGTGTGTGSVLPEPSGPTVASSVVGTGGSTRAASTSAPGTTTEPPATTGAATSAPATPAPTAPTAGPMVITAPDSDGFPDGIVSGVLVERDGCLYVDDDSIGLGVALFAHGTAWDPATGSIVGPGGEAVAIGAPLYTGGGAFDLGSVAGGDDATSTLLRRCADAAGITRVYLIGLFAGPP